MTNTNVRRRLRSDGYGRKMAKRMLLDTPGTASVPNPGKAASERFQIPVSFILDQGKSIYEP